MADQREATPQTLLEKRLSNGSNPVAGAYKTPAGASNKSFCTTALVSQYPIGLAQPANYQQSKDIQQQLSFYTGCLVDCIKDEQSYVKNKAAGAEAVQNDFSQQSYITAEIDAFRQNHQKLPQNWLRDLYIYHANIPGDTESPPQLLQAVVQANGKAKTIAAFTKMQQTPELERFAQWALQLLGQLPAE